MMKKFTAKLFASLLAVTTAASAMALPAAAADGSWKQDANGWWYSYSAGGFAKNGWVKVGSTWYYFSPNGYMKTGWVKDNGTWYYMAGSGAMKTGWLQEKGEWYFFAGNGAMKTGWVKSGSKWYYMDELGKMKTDSLLKLGEETYYLDKDGVMFVGEMEYQGAKMTFDASGKLVKDGGAKTETEEEKKKAEEEAKKKAEEEAKKKAEEEAKKKAEEEAKKPQVTFGTPTGWTTTSADGTFILTREDAATSSDGSNIMIMVASLEDMTAEEKALIGNPEAYVMDKETLDSVKATLEQNKDLPFKDVVVTGAVNKTTKGKSAATFTITANVVQTGVKIPYKVSQTHILYDKAIVIVQLATTDALFSTYETDLNKILASIDIA